MSLSNSTLLASANAGDRLTYLPIPQPYTKARTQALELELEVRVEGMVARRLAEQVRRAQSVTAFLTAT